MLLDRTFVCERTFKSLTGDISIKNSSTVFEYVFYAYENQDINYKNFQLVYYTRTKNNKLFLKSKSQNYLTTTQIIASKKKLMSCTKDVCVKCKMMKGRANYHFIQIDTFLLLHNVQRASMQ